MRRSATEVIRRGFDSTLANWPVVAIRIAENVLFVIIFFAALIAAIVPLVVSLGINRASIADASSAAEAVLALVTDHWPVLLYIIGLFSVLLLVLMILHSFVTAGCALVFVEAEKKASALPAPGRRDMEAFSADTWLRGGKRGWWPVFWIFNVAWGFATLLMMVPLLIFAVLALLAQSTPAAAIAIGCLGLVVTLLFAVAVSIVTNIWVQKAIVVCLARGAGAVASLQNAWRDFRLDAARHLAVAIVILVVLFAGSFFLGVSSAMIPQGHHHSPGLLFTFMPIQIASSLLSSIFSAGVAAWLLACLAVLTMDPRR